MKLKKEGQESLYQQIPVTSIPTSISENPSNGVSTTRETLSMEPETSNEPVETRCA